MKIGLYSISYLGIWYAGPALSFEQFVKRAKACGYAGIELDGKRPHGNPMDLDRRARERMRTILEREGMEIRAWLPTTISPALSLSTVNVSC